VPHRAQPIYAVSAPPQYHRRLCEVILAAYEPIPAARKRNSRIDSSRREKQIAAGKLAAAKRKLYKRELAAGRNLEEFKKDVRMLQRWMDKSQEAKREMVESNLRLVISIAKKYNQPRSLFPRSDSGREHGLDEAVEKFEYRRGY